MVTSSSQDPRFHTTLWDVVRTAGTARSPHQEEALEALCRVYWYPLYAFLRRKGQQPEDAADLVQGFFAALLARDDLSSVEPARGRFRSYLMAALSHYVAKERAAQQAEKRGGGRVRLEIDTGHAEERFRREPRDNRSPERMFDRAWALTVLERSLERLEQEQRGAARKRLFEGLRGHLAGTPAEGGLAQVAEEVGSSSGAVKVALHRLRVRYREILRREISETLGEGEDVEGELGLLMEALSPGNPSAR